jgi:hypothetical protein
MLSHELIKVDVNFEVLFLYLDWYDCKVPRVCFYDNPFAHGTTSFHANSHILLRKITWPCSLLLFILNTMLKRPSAKTALTKRCPQRTLPLQKSVVTYMHPDTVGSNSDLAVSVCLDSAVSVCSDSAVSVCTHQLTKKHEETNGTNLY